MTHHFSVRVYYEDTDLAGIVYYANYLKFIERARSEWVRAAGIDQVQMKAQGQVFVVRRVLADYLAPARYDDLLDVRTEVQSCTGARLVLGQEVWRDDIRLFAADVTLICMTDQGAITRLPRQIIDLAR